MGALWLAALIVTVSVAVWATCRMVDRCRSLPPLAPVRANGARHVRVWPAWWAELDGWRDELEDGAA